MSGVSTPPVPCKEWSRARRDYVPGLSHPFPPNSPAGGWVRCPRCSLSFQDKSPEGAPVESPGHRPGGSGGPRGTVDRKRLGVVLGLAGLYLLIGTGVAGYCFAVNKPTVRPPE